jgi:hypothetical protein
MKNETDRQIARFRKLSGPTQIVFIAKAPQPVPNLFREANAATTALSKTTILPMLEK